MKMKPINSIFFETLNSRKSTINSVIKPAFRIEIYKDKGADGESIKNDIKYKEDITNDIKENLISLNFNDKDGQHSDEMSLSMNGIYSRILGSRLNLSLGVDDELYDYGIFFVNSISVDYAGQKTDVKATSIDFSGPCKINQTRSWQNITLHKLVEQIAYKNSLDYFISDGVSDVSLGTISQKNINDLEFLFRISEKYGYIMSVKNDTINILYKNYVSQYTESHVINILDCSSLNIDKSHKTHYGSATLYWNDTKIGKSYKATFGTKDPCYNFEGPIPQSMEEGKKIAAAQLIRANLNEVKGTLTTSVIKEIRAGNFLYINGTDEDDGEYYIESVSHSFSSSGYSMDISFKGKINYG